MTRIKKNINGLLYWITHLAKKIKSYQDILDLWQFGLPNHYVPIGSLLTEEFQTSSNSIKTSVT